MLIPALTTLTIVFYGPTTARMEMGEKNDLKIEYDGETRNHFRFT